MTVGKLRSWLFGAEPALVLSFVAAVLGVGTAAVVPGLTVGQVALIMAALNAVLGAVQAALTRPVAPTAFVTLVAALAALAGGYSFHVSTTMLAAIDAVILTIPPLLVRLQVTPVAKLRAAARAGSPAGPAVVSESPYAQG
jgi:small basic protein